MPLQCDFAPFAGAHRPDTTITLRAGEFLFREGDEADALFIVTRGTVRIMSGSVVYEVVHAGGIVGEMAVVERDAPRSASVIAGTYAELVRMDASDFLSRLATAPDFALMVMRVMARRLRQMNLRYRPQAVAW